MDRVASPKLLKKVPGWGLSPKIPQPSYNDTQHMYIGRGCRIGITPSYGYTVNGGFTVMSRTAVSYTHLTLPTILLV